MLLPHIPHLSLLLDSVCASPADKNMTDRQEKASYRIYFFRVTKNIH